MDHMNDEGYITPFAQPSDVRHLDEEEARRARETWRQDYAERMLFAADDTRPYQDYLVAGDFTRPVPKPVLASSAPEAPLPRLVPTSRGIAVAWCAFGVALGFAAAIIIVVVTTW